MLKVILFILGWLGCGVLAVIIDAVWTSLDPYDGPYGDDGGELVILLGPISLAIILIHIALLILLLAFALVAGIIEFIFEMIVVGFKKIFLKPATK